MVWSTWVLILGVCFYSNNDLTQIQKGNSFASGYFCWNVLPEKLIFEKLTLIQERYDGTPCKKAI